MEGGYMVEVDIISAISQLGFPIAVATYALVVLNNTIRKNTEVLTKIAVKLDVPTQGDN
jgi:hypothetical protein